MRKIFLLIPLLFICTITTHSYAIDPTLCNSYTTKEECPAGCFYKDGRCTACDVGTYSDQSGQTGCKKCYHPTKGIWDWADESVGHESNECPWIATCAYNEYWDISGIIDGSNFGCTQCGTNYNSKLTESSTYEISGQGIVAVDGLKYLQDAVCDGKVYKLTLVKNLTNFLEKDKYAYVKYNEGFSDSENGDFLFDGTAPNVTPTFKWWQKFEGYFTEKSGGSIRFNSDGGTARTQTTPTTFTGDTTLYGHWDETPVEYKVEYYTDSSMTTKFSTTQTCEMGMECPVKTDKPSQSGKLFDHWVCGAGCSGTVTDNIPEPTESYYDTGQPIKLYAAYADCPDGYYCSGGKQNPCPAGTTSAGGASSDKDCYMVTGTNGTKFCDTSNGNEKRCFYLPLATTSGGNITFNPQ